MAATLTLTPSLRRHLDCPEARVDGTNVREALESYFQLNRSLRGYVLDDQGALRKHVAIFVDGTLIRDRQGLSDPIGDGAEIFLVQSLSGG